MAYSKIKIRICISKWPFRTQQTRYMLSTFKSLTPRKKVHGLPMEPLRLGVYGIRATNAFGGTQYDDSAIGWGYKWISMVPISGDFFCELNPA
jgi:hypothetical protein